MSRKRVSARRPSQPAPGPMTGPPEAPATRRSAQEHLYEVERHLDALLREVDQAGGGTQARRRAADAIEEIASRLSPDDSADTFDADALLSTARQLLSTDYYLRQWGRLGMRHRSEQVDEFGLDPTYEERVAPLLDMLYRRYFRVRTSGVERIPDAGRALIVCNHSGALPFDGLMLKAAILDTHPAARKLRWLNEDYVFHFAFLGAFMNRVGGVRACQENAQRLLNREELLAVFPEGIKGIGKVYRERYRLQRFGRGGYVKLAIRTGTPIIPAAVIGSEETYPLLYKMKAFSKFVGLPFIPITPLFPALGPMGLLPLPSRWQIRFGKPVTEVVGRDRNDAEDTVLINEINERVRGAVQDLIAEGLAARGDSVFL